jgi:ABC-type phosphate transport system substrate-binding protein
MTVINLETTPALAHWLPLAAACADELPNLGLATILDTEDNLSPGKADLTLRLGPREESDPFVTVLGQEQLVVLAGVDVPLTEVNLESLRQIYSGDMSQWGDLPALEGAEGPDGPITAFGYPRGHELAEFFSRIYLGETPHYAVTQSYSTLERMAELLQENPTGIAYALAGQVPPNVLTLAVTDLEPGKDAIWVLAVTPDEPVDGLRQLLLCLQNAQ